MAFLVLVLDDGYEQALPRKTHVDQHLAFQKSIILAVAPAVERIVPTIDDAPMIHVADGLDMRIDPVIDVVDVAQGLGGKVDVAGGGPRGAAFALVALAEVAPAI